MVYHPVKWYVYGIVSEINWDYDVDLMFYMQIEWMIKSEKYDNIRWLWYWNPKFSFSRSIIPIKCDTTVLKFDEDVNGFELVDVNLKHNIDNSDVIDEAKLRHDYDEEVRINGDCGPNLDDDDEVQKRKW